MNQITPQEVAEAQARHRAASDAMEDAISEREPGDVIDLRDLLRERPEIDPNSLFRVAERLWCGGCLDQGQTKREYIIL